MDGYVASHLDNVLIMDRFKKRLKHAVKKLKDVDFDTVAVSGHSGVIFGSALAIAMDKKLVIVRKKSDKENSHSWLYVEGEIGKKYIVVDDFISSGTTRERVRRRLAQSEDFSRMKMVGTWEYARTRGADGDSYDIGEGMSLGSFTIGSIEELEYTDEDLK